MTETTGTTGTTGTAGSTALFHDLVRRHARRTPGAPAVECGGQRLSYQELITAADRLAEELAARGAGPEALVGVAAAPGVELPVAILGVLAAGAAWLPLDPAYPVDRLRYMVADSGVRLVVAPAATGAALALDIELVEPLGPDGSTATQAAPVGTAATAARPTGAGPGNLAYAIYTSGSTGRPKGVAVSHGGLANLIAAQAAAFDVRPGARVLQFAPTSFDASVFEIAMALATGATLVLAAREDIAPGPGLADFLREHRITHLTLPPSVLATLPGPALPELRQLVCAGEALPEHLVTQWAPGRRMFNAYGPTETTVWATLARVRADGGRPSIGTAVHGVHVVVLDGRGRPVPPGTPGELAVGGHGVTRGYLGQAARTAERFVPDPTAPWPGARVYLTGDRVRVDAAGALEFLGRVDHQVKIRGFRIEPDEIAARLADHPRVTDAVVIARADPPRVDPPRIGSTPAAGAAAPGQEARLVGYVTGDRPDPPALLEHLRAALPGYMIPSAIVVLDRMPLTPSGKIDRAALPAPVRPTAAGGHGHVEPATPTERGLAAILAELLGVEEVGTADDFFALGGHSLLAGRLAARVRAELGRELPLARIYTARTVAAMAALLDLPGDASDEQNVLPPIRVAPHPSGVPAALSLPQERIWFLETLSPGNLAYNAQATLRLDGPLEVAALRATLTEIVRRHQVMRTAYVAVDGRPVQIPHEPAPVALPVVDLTGLPVAQREARAEAVVAETMRDPFDLASPPLVRWRLIRHAPGEHTLVHVEHHLVHDGWAFSVFVDELRTLYPALAAGRPSPLPEPAVQYLDFVRWQRDWMRGDVLRRYLRHWTAELAGCPVALELPTDRPRPPAQTFAGAALRVDLPGELCRRLRAYSRSRGVTLFATMLAGFATLLSRHSGQDDVVIGSGLANRRLAEIERMLGMVVNTVPLRVGLAGSPDFDTLVRRVHEVLGRAQEWQDVPLERLVDALGLPRDPARTPLFSVLFSFHDSQVPALELGEVRGTVLERHNGSAKTDINVVVIPRAEQRLGHGSADDAAPITLIWEYATDLFDPATTERMVAGYRLLLDAATARPEVDVRRLPLLGDAQRVATLERSRGPRPAYPAGRTIPALFAEQVAARPAATAVVCAGRTLSYAALDERSSRIAHLLRAAGVGPDVPVGVLLERDEELVTVLLAVLKAGGGYVPLDPAYPAARLADMLADIAAPVVVTTSALRDRLAPGDRPAPGDRRVLVLDELAGQLRAAPATPPAPAAGPTGLAYVLFTSGSTGRPKGVQVAHRSVLRLVFGTDYAEFGPGERIAQVADTAFDAFTFELWGALLHGGGLHMIGTDQLLTPGGLGAALREHRITAMFLTSALFTEVMSTHPDSFAGLRTLIVGGDALHVQRVRRLLAAPPEQRPARLVNGYGPTETTTFAVCHHIESLTDGAPSVPIGRPIANTTGYVLDEHLAPVPQGVAGQLHIGGPGVARGYAGRPALTAQRFLPDPFAADGSRMYATGDRVRYLPDGTLEFLGRVDDQVKIRGFRVEPGELENALTAHPAVAQAAVRVTGQAAERGLIAYLVLVAGPADQEPAGAGQVGRIREHLAGTLPPYLLPAGYVLLDAMPMTPSGKIDRAALPAPDGQMLRPDAYRAPATPTERAVAELVAGTLGATDVGATDDFFALGGNSLLAMRLVAEINERLSTRVALRQFLLTPTVAAIASEVDACRVADPPGPVPAGGTRDDERLLERLDELSDDEVDALLDEMTGLDELADKEADR